jgi:hypothetical protein
MTMTDSPSEGIMRRFAIALTIALLSTPAFAQDVAGSNKHHGAPKQKTEPAKVKADDKDYKAALDRLPTQKYDPWGAARPVDAKK